MQSAWLQTGCAVPWLNKAGVDNWSVDDDQDNDVDDRDYAVFMIMMMKIIIAKLDHRNKNQKVQRTKQKLN